MESEPVNGTGSSADEQTQQSQAMLQSAVDAYGKALVQSKSLGAQLNVNVVDMMVQGELMKIQFALLVEALVSCGIVNPIAWRAVLAQRLQYLTAELTQPRIAIATGMRQ